MLVTIFLTGFSSFDGVDCNPTEVLINHLKGSSLNLEYDDTCTIEARLEVVKVAVHSVNELLDSFIPDPSCELILLVHLGVDCNDINIKLERTAWNDMSFRIPDVHGYQPNAMVIEDNLPLTHVRTTTINLSNVCQFLRSMDESIPVVLSDDAGRYLCNYIYYKSLQIQSKFDNSRSLFIHVPTFDKVSMDVQLNIIVEILRMIIKQQKGEFHHLNI